MPSVVNLFPSNDKVVNNVEADYTQIALERVRNVLQVKKVTSCKVL